MEFGSGIEMRKLENEELHKLREKLIDMTYENKFNTYIGMEWVELNVNYGKSRIKYGPNVLNPYGIFHGGVLLALADATAGTCACMGGYYVTTVSQNLNFLLEAKNTEFIYCECMKLKTGKNISVFDIRITDDKGNLLDSGEFSFFNSRVAVI